MLGSERQNEIINYLRIHGSASVKKLTGIVFASEATVRRDLNELEKIGSVRRIFGGATLAVGADKQIPLFVREQEDGAAKTEICRRAAEMISDGSVIFVDGSSTAQHLIPFLSRFKDIIVITNGLKIAGMLYEMHIKTYCTGGRLLEGSSVFVGKDAQSFVDRFNTDICFISCKGLDENGKFSDTSEEETELRRRVLANAKKKVVLLTAQKIGRSYIHTLCKASEVDEIYTDGVLPSGVSEGAK